MRLELHCSLVQWDVRVFFFRLVSLFAQFYLVQPQYWASDCSLYVNICLASWSQVSVSPFDTFLLSLQSGLGIVHLIICPVLPCAFVQSVCPVFYFSLVVGLVFVFRSDLLGFYLSRSCLKFFYLLFDFWISTVVFMDS